jgi:hypothetical protein
MNWWFKPALPILYEFFHDLYGGRSSGLSINNRVRKKWVGPDG